jgi:hypothetical protein
MPSSQSSDLIQAMKVVTSVLRDAKVRFAVGGGLAAWARGGPPTEHDIDLMVKPGEVERALHALDDSGIVVSYPPEGWLAKAHYGDVLIDLIFDPKGYDIDDAFFERSDVLNVASVDVPVMSLDDLLVGKLLTLTEHHLDFGPPLEWARALREQIDWGVVARRTCESPFARTFLYMLQELGVLADLRAKSGQHE